MSKLASSPAHSSVASCDISRAVRPASRASCSAALRHASYRYPKTHKLVIDDLSLELKAGECIGLIGSNGGGKSTLLSLIAGLLPMQEGELVIGDSVYAGIHGGTRSSTCGGTHSVARTKRFWRREKSQARKEIGYVPQFAESQFFGLTIADQLKAVMQAVNKDTDELEGLLRRVGLPASFLDRSPWTLSGGERRRLGIAFALAQDCPILLFDEPLIGLDELSMSYFFDCIRAMCDDGKICIIASNLLDELWDYADRVLVLDKGKLIADGPARELLSDKDLLAQVHAERPLQAVLSDYLKDGVCIREVAHD